jgi:hypothetical protein
MTAPQFTAPPGDPARLDAAATALDQVAAGLRDQRDRIGRQNEQVRAIWTSDAAAPTALLAAGTLQTAAGDYGQALRAGAGIVRSYARALGEAQQATRGLQQRAATVEEQVQNALARCSPEARPAVLEQATAAYRPLLAQHQQLLADVDGLARQAGEQLGALAPTPIPAGGPPVSPGAAGPAPQLAAAATATAQPPAARTRQVNTGQRRFFGTLRFPDGRQVRVYTNGTYWGPPGSDFYFANGGSEHLYGGSNIIYENSGVRINVVPLDKIPAQ